MKKRLLSATLSLVLSICCFNVSAFALPSTTYPLSEIVTYNGHSYAIVDYKTDWFTAKEYCEQLGGHLVTITSEDEEQAIIPLYRYKEYYFTGGYTEDHETWKWITGETFEYSNWAPGEPNNVGGVETVIHLNRFEEVFPNSGWNDIPSSSQEKFIIEWDTLQVYPTSFIVVNGYFLNVRNGKTLQIVLEFPSGAIFTDVTWVSSDPTIASVDQNGLVKGLKNGTATITITAANGVTAIVAIKVTY